MPTTEYQTSTIARTVTATHIIRNTISSPTTAGIFTQSIPSGTYLDLGFAMTSPGIVDAYPSGGGYSMSLDVTAIGSSVSISSTQDGMQSYTSAARFTSDLLTRRGVAQSGTFADQWVWSSTAGVGLKTANLTVTSWSVNGSQAASDRPVFHFRVTNQNMMSAESISLRGNTANSYVTGPWSLIPPPNAPTNLTATGDMDSINLSWTAPTTGTPPTSYDIHRVPNKLSGADSNFYTGLGNWSAASTNVNLSWDSQSARVTANVASTANAGGRPEVLIPIAPSSPVTVSANVQWITGTPKAVRLGLLWYATDGSLFGTSYTGTITPGTNSFTTTSGTLTSGSNIYYCRPLVYFSGTPAVGDEFRFNNVTVSTESVVKIATVTAPSTVYDDINVVLDQNYAYKLNSVAESRPSIDSNTVTANLSSAPAVAPGQTTGLTVTGTTHNSVDLSWTAPTTGTAPFEYAVERTDSGSITPIFTNGTTLTDTGLSASRTYSYVVSAANDAGVGPNSNSVNATTTAAPVAPGTVTNLRTSAIGDTSVSLLWDVPTGTAPFTYTVKRNGTTLSNSVSTNSYTDSTTSSSTSYTYTVLATNAAGAGSESAPLAVTTTGPQILVPTGDGVIVGAWTTDTGATTNLYTAIDEISPGAVGDYVQSPAGAGTSDLYRCTFTNALVPTARTGHKFIVRHGKDATGGSSVDLTVSLRQGEGTVIAERTFTAAEMEVTDRTDTITLTEAQANLITDYADLRMEFDPTFGGGQKRSYRVYWAQVELPSAAPIPDPPTNVTAITDADSINVSWTAPTSGPAPTSYTLYRTGGNALTGDDSDFTNGLGEWTSSTSTLENTASVMRITTSGTGLGVANGRAIPVSEGDTVTITGQVRNVTGVRPAALGAVTYTDAAGSAGQDAISDGESGNSVPPSSFETKSFTTVIPSGVLSIRPRIYVRIDGAVGGEVHEWDNFTLSVSKSISTGTTATTYDDASGLPNTTYTYKVRSHTSATKSVYSATAQATTGPLTLSATPDADSINLSWNQPTGTNPDSYKIYRDPGNAVWSDNFDVPNSTAMGGQLAWTEPTDINQQGWAIVNNEAENTLTNKNSRAYLVQQATSPDMFAEALLTQFTWLSTYEIGFNLRIRFLDESNHYSLNRSIKLDGLHYWSLSKSVGGTSTELASGTQTYIVREKLRVEAVGSTVRAYINDVLMAEVTDASLSTGRSASISSWRGASTSVKIAIDDFRMGDLGIGQVALVTTPTTIYDDTTVAPGVNYTYTVRPVVGGTEGVDSNSITASLVLPPSAPGSPTLTATSSRSGEVDLSWSAAGGYPAPVYDIMMSTSENGTYTEVAGDWNTTSYTITELALDQTYWFKVIARNSEGAAESNTSSVVVASGPPTISSFIDDFEDGVIDTNLWVPLADTTESNGRLNMPSTATYPPPMVRSTNRQILTESSIFIDVGTWVNTGENTLAFMLEATPGSSFSIYASADQLNFTTYIDASPDNVSIAYNASAMRYWRFRHSGTTVYWEYSGDAVNWTIGKQQATTYNTDALYIMLESSHWGSTQTVQTIEGVNVIAAAPPPPATITEITALDGSSEPTYRTSQHHVARTNGGRMLVVNGWHGTGVMLSWSDDEGATWSRTTRGDALDGGIVRGLGTGDVPASIAVVGDYAYVIWGRNSSTLDVNFRRLSDIDGAGGPIIGVANLLTSTGRLPDVCVETASNGQDRVVLAWWNDNAAVYSNQSAYITDLTSETPALTQTQIVSASGLGRYGSLISRGSGLGFVHRGASGNLRLHFKSNTAAPTDAWTEAASAGPVVVTATPNGVFASSKWVAAIDTNTTVGSQACIVQSWSEDGTTTTTELTMTGYENPTLTTDGTLVFVVAHRLSDDSVISRRREADGTWGPDFVEMPTTNGGTHNYPNVMPTIPDGELRFVTEALTDFTPQSQVLYGTRTAIETTPPPTPIEDDFNRPDSTTTLGPDWTIHQGTWGIKSGRAYSVTEVDHDHATVNAGTPEMTVRAVTYGHASATFPDILARYVDTDNFFKFGYQEPSLVLYRRVGGTYTQLGPSVPYTPTPGDEYTLSCIGADIVAELNGVPVITVTDAALSTAVRAGIRKGGSGSGVEFESFSVNAETTIATFPWLGTGIRPWHGLGTDTLI